MKYSVKKESALTLQDIRKARLNFKARQEFNREGPSMEPDGKTKQNLRILARKTLGLVRQKGLKLSQEEWYKRLVGIFRTRNNKVRQRLMKELESYADER